MLYDKEGKREREREEERESEKQRKRANSPVQFEVELFNCVLIAQVCVY